MARSPKPRRRLDAEAARAVILDAAERRLASVGPAGIRLQEVAADAGLSHPTLLHHFGSREQLVKAVISRALHAMDTTIIEAIAASGGNDQQLEDILENVAASLERTGHARMLLWLALEGHRIEPSDARLGEVVDATHALRGVRNDGTKSAPREDTARMIVLAALALVSGSVLGASIFANAGLGDDEGPRFRRWLARLLIEHLDRGQ